MWFGIAKWLASFLSGPIVNGIISAYKAKLAATNTTDAQAADLAAKEIAGETALRQTEASIIRQEQGWWLTALPRPLMGLCVTVLVGKLLIWDLAFGQWTGGHTDKLSDQTFWIMQTIIVAYFGGRTIEKVARIFKH